MLTALFPLIKPVADIVMRRQDRKTATDAVKGKIAQAKVEGAQEVNLKRAEWENIAVESTKDSWKDEYVTIVITSPILLIIIGTVYAAFTGDMRLLDAAGEALSRLEKIGLQMGELMFWVVLAAVGIRGAKSLSR